MSELEQPSVGLDRLTGGTITGWDHVVQSIEDFFTTSFGERIMREWYGTFVPNLLGKNLSTREVTPFFAAVTSAILTWEPRYRVTQVIILDVTRQGELTYQMIGQYRPRALLNDFTPEGTKKLDVFAGGRGFEVLKRLTA